MALSFAIVGCGRIAQRHAEKMQPYGSLVAVCDIIAEKADVLALKYNSKSFYSIEALLTCGIAIDVIAVCTPNGLHAQHSIAALKAGMHVLCEKPMAIASADCLQMIESAENNNRKLFIVKQNRFNPPVAAVQQMIAANKLGKIYSMQLNCFWNRDAAYYKDSWKGTKALDGGTLYTQFSHFIDLLYWFFGDIKNISAVTTNAAHKNIIEFEDCGAVLLQFENGIIGTINYTVNSHQKNMEGSLTLFAEKGTIKIGGQYLNELEYQSVDDGLKIGNLPAGNHANNYGTYTGSMSNHDKVYENLNDVLLHGGEMYTNAHEGLKTVEIIERIYKAAAR